MTELDNPVDTTAPWASRHLRAYTKSGGVRGHVWHGAPSLLLTTIGRRSGLARRTPLIYGQDGEHYLVVASLGGAPKHPLWYENLVAEPKVRVQVVDDVFDATARTATADEKPRLWSIMAAIWPDYEKYQRKTTRDIPVVILTRS